MPRIGAAPRPRVDAQLKPLGVQEVRQLLHGRELGVGLYSVVLAATEPLPAIVDIDVAPSVVGEALLQHGAGRTHHLFLADAVSPAVPGVPAQRGRESDAISDDDTQLPLERAGGIACAQQHLVRTGLACTALDDALGGVQLKTTRQSLGLKVNGAYSGGGDAEDEFCLGTGAVNFGPVDTGSVRSRRGKNECGIIHGLILRLCGKRHERRKSSYEQIKVI